MGLPLLWRRRSLKTRRKRKREDRGEFGKCAHLSSGSQLGERIARPDPSSCRPLHIHLEALGGGCCDGPVCSKAEEEEEKPSRGSSQPTTASSVAGEEGQTTPPPIGVADNSDQVNRGDQDQTHRQAGCSSRGCCRLRGKRRRGGGKDCVC